jgi:hypothetical protein
VFSGVVESAFRHQPLRRCRQRQAAKAMMRRRVPVFADFADTHKARAGHAVGISFWILTLPSTWA